MRKSADSTGEGQVWKRFWLAIAWAVFFLVAGFGMRLAEDNQVGYTHDASMWVFGVSGLCVYYALVVIWIWRRKCKK